jgi:hypothetical protein
LHEAWKKLFGKITEVSEQASGALEFINNIPGCPKCDALIMASTF